MGKHSDKLQESYNQLTFISSIGQKFISTLKFEKVLEIVYENLSSLFNAVVFGIVIHDKESNNVVFEYFIENGEVIAKESIPVHSKDSLAAKCIRENKEILIGNLSAERAKHRTTLFGDLSKIPNSIIYIPLVVKDSIIGAVTVQNYEINKYTQQHLETLRALGSYIAAALENAMRHKEVKKLNNLLSKEKKELEKANETIKQLAERAHRAGMAEVAADTLHNVGNILNSLKTSAHIIKETINNNHVESYSKACDMMRENRDNLIQFLQHDSKGEKLADYFFMLEEEFRTSYGTIEKQTERVIEKIGNISNVVIAQQSYLGTSALIESLDITQIVEDALILVPALLTANQIELVKHYESVPEIPLQKSKLLHVLINIFDNALHALINNENDSKQLKISIYCIQKAVYLEISDNGYGIPPENLSNIFKHGFSSKEEGFGFGLHSCAIYLEQMSANIKVESPGIGKGSTFTLKFPV